MPDFVTDLRRHALVGFDTTVFIYHFEGVAPHAGPAAVALFELARGSFQGVTSILTLMELVVRPLQFGRPDLATSYEFLVRNWPNLSTNDVDGPVARRAAHLRATHRVHAVDAVHIATCLQQGATAYVTNDRRLRRVTETDVLLLDDYLPGAPTSAAP